MSNAFPITPEPAKKSVTVTFRLPEDLLLEVDAAAKLTGHNRTAILTHGIRWWVEEFKATRNPPKKTG